jgi:transcriptional regulator with XRE-family HTH domain
MTPTQRLANFRRNIRHLCDQERGAHTRLAKAAGISKEYLSAMLAGRYQPSAMTALALADALDSTIGHLMLPHKKFLESAKNSA